MLASDHRIPAVHITVDHGTDDLASVVQGLGIEGGELAPRLQDNGHSVPNQSAVKTNDVPEVIDIAVANDDPVVINRARIARDLVHFKPKLGHGQRRVRGEIYRNEYKPGLEVIV